MLYVLLTSLLPNMAVLKKLGKKNFQQEPVSGFEGTDSFNYQITDGEAYVWGGSHLYGRRRYVLAKTPGWWLIPIE